MASKTCSFYVCSGIINMPAAMTAMTVPDRPKSPAAYGSRAQCHAISSCKSEEFIRVFLYHPLHLLFRTAILEHVRDRDAESF